MGLLRFLLALSVVIEHTSPIFGLTFVGGVIAVKAFYVISGFYMALILKEKYVTSNHSSYKLFITNRFLRLYPVYWTVLVLTIFFSIIISINSHGVVSGRFSGYVQYWSKMNFSALLFLIFTNVFLFLQDFVMFLGLNTTTGNLFFTSNFHATSPMLFNFLLIPQAWTIGVELTFYLVAPFLVKQKIQWIVILIILSLGLRIFLAKIGLKSDPWSYRFFPTELVFFLAGIISYHIYNRVRNMQIKSFYLKLIFTGIIGLTLSYSLFANYITFYLYLLFIFLSIPFIFKLTKKWKIDRLIGELSYPIYISHMLLLYCVQSLKIRMVGGLGITVCTSTIIFSFLLNMIISKKIEKFRQGRINPGIL